MWREWLPHRLCADAPLEDLTVPTAQEVNRYRQVYLKRSSDLMRGIERRRMQSLHTKQHILLMRNSGHKISHLQSLIHNSTTPLKRSSDLMRGIERRRKDTVGDFLSRAKISYKKNECNQLEVFEIPGTVLHIDGDKEYLDLCLSTYKQLNIRATGFYIPEPGHMHESTHGAAMTQSWRRHESMIHNGTDRRRQR